MVRTNSCTPTLQLKDGDTQLRGTYFHPELVLKVLMWANTKLATEMEKIIWSAVIV